ncbi:hypothetical protein [Hymenobacter coccineus]|uniref:hypothetical protein n=1 Tax=Hymenobacter coccineus TaxID=1908235 RepID=UPI000F7B521B|nr:hypothetical protein [Hymenobacter coccineus]
MYKAFGQSSAAVVAQRLFKQTFAQLVGQLLPAPAMPMTRAWSADQLEQACAAAWLGARFTAAGLSSAPALLTTLDPLLQREALRLCSQPEPASRRSFSRILRYFSLRLPDARSHLVSLLDPSRMAVILPVPTLSAVPEPLQLGLDDGLASELLLLIELYQAGLQDDVIVRRVREGIQYLLALRRDVDFLEQKYSVFPSSVHPYFQEATYGAALGWPKGDLGQVLLLYEANRLLGDNELAKIAELIGLNTLLRTSREATDVIGAQFYQGAAGVAHLYRRLYQVSGQVAYREGQYFWLDRTQIWLDQELASGSYSYEHRKGNLSHGLVGIGLVLLCEVAGMEWNWETSLL